MVKHFSGHILDETFINAYEDHEISLKFSLEHLTYTFIDYKIGDYIGSSLGNGVSRNLRNISGLAYLNYKYEGGELDRSVSMSKLS